MRRAGPLAWLWLLPALTAAQGPLAPPPAPIPEARAADSSVPAATLLPMAGSAAPPAFVPPALLEAPNGWTFDAWLDLPHAFLERRIFGIVDGFDRFFADERDLDSARANSFVRLRSALRVETDGRLTYSPSVHADLALPHIRRRLERFRVVLENAGREVSGSGPDPLTGIDERARADALLRLTLLDTLRSSFDLGGGVLLDLPPGLIGRVRFRHAHELGRVALARFALSGFWNTREGLGSNGSIAFERALVRRLLLRWTTGTLRSQVSHGYESSSELALLAPIGRFTGLTLLGAAATRSKPDLVVQTWRVAARLRTTLYRGWIFGEIEPEVAWPLDDAGGRRRVPAVIFRLEIQFEEAARKTTVAAGRQSGLASTMDRHRGDA
ncbi:MAG: hypothetical protein WCC48_11540 [Anaeromyxobacteraceae bacterium]